eukprot:1193304-Pyramimonas_sp.AAC.1
MVSLYPYYPDRLRCCGSEREPNSHTHERVTKVLYGFNDAPAEVILRCNKEPLTKKQEQMPAARTLNRLTLPGGASTFLDLDCYNTWPLT